MMPDTRLDQEDRDWLHIIERHTGHTFILFEPLVGKVTAHCRNCLTALTLDYEEVGPWRFRGIPYSLFRNRIRTWQGNLDSRCAYTPQQE